MSGILYPGGSTPIPLCPSRRIRAAPERAGCASPVPGGQAKPMEVLCQLLLARQTTDRKSTRLNSSHTVISYAVFCLKKKKKTQKKKKKKTKQRTEKYTHIAPTKQRI